MVHKVKYFLFSIVAFSTLLSGCSNDPSTASTEEKFTTGSKNLDQTLEAHGGVETWRKYATMTFSKSSESNPQTENHLIDLNNRKTLILGTSFRMGFDGANVWVTPGLDKSPSKTPRFYHNLWFYFASIPFVLTDPGVKVEDLEPIEIGGISYNRIGITFEKEVGASSQDQYILYTHPKNHLVQLINYSVTFFDESKSDQFNALTYENYEEVQGLMFPTLLTGYTWENDNLGKKRYETYLFDYKFGAESPIQSMFQIPVKEKKLFVDSLQNN